MLGLSRNSSVLALFSILLATWVLDGKASRVVFAAASEEVVDVGQETEEGGEARRRRNLGGRSSVDAKLSPDLFDTPDSVAAGSVLGGSGPVQQERNLATQTGTTAFIPSGFTDCGPGSNGYPSSFFQVNGTGEDLTASTCGGGTNYDTRLIVREACSPMKCIGAYPYILQEVPKRLHTTSDCLLSSHLWDR
jgi:hypothetical protein